MVILAIVIVPKCAQNNKKQSENQNFKNLNHKINFGHLNWYYLLKCHKFIMVNR